MGNVQYQYRAPEWYARHRLTSARITGIVIRVSDGTTMLHWPLSRITVTQVTNGTATISWIPPTQNTDGSALTDLAGYRIYYGTSPSSLNQNVELSNPGLTSSYGTGPLACHLVLRHAIIPH